MNKTEIWFNIRDDIKKGQIVFDSIQESLLNVGFSYPYMTDKSTLIMTDNIQFDSIQGDNFKGFMKQMNIFIRKLNNKLPDAIKPIFKSAKIDKSFSYKNQNEKVEYYPMTVEFDDGQQLIGLARQYGKAQKTPIIDKQEAIKINRWYLNGKDINKVVFNDKNTIGDIDKQAYIISAIVEKNHNSFVKKYPNLQFNKDDEIQAEIDKLKAENETLKGQIEEAKAKATPSQELGITAENIAEFYPTMSDEDKLKYQDLLDSVFQKRIIDVANGLNLSSKELFESGSRVTDNKGAGNNVVGVEHFGVKDNLEPIDEYIAKIKASPEYQEYIESKENENKKSDSELLDEIKNNATYKQILKDSFGGVMYNIGNADNYNMKDIEALKSLWKQIKNKGVADGIVKGAMGFIEDEVTKSEAYQKYIASKGSEDNQDIKQQAEDLLSKFMSEDKTEDDKLEIVKQMQELYNTNKEALQDIYKLFKQEITK